jgi:hypothetical protein
MLANQPRDLPLAKGRRTVLQRFTEDDVLMPKPINSLKIRSVLLSNPAWLPARPQDGCGPHFRRGGFFSEYLYHFLWLH